MTFDVTVTTVSAAAQCAEKVQGVEKPLQTGNRPSLRKNRGDNRDDEEGLHQNQTGTPQSPSNDNADNENIQTVNDNAQADMGPQENKLEAENQAIAKEQSVQSEVNFESEYVQESAEAKNQESESSDPKSSEKHRDLHLGIRIIKTQKKDHLKERRSTTEDSGKEIEDQEEKTPEKDYSKRRNIDEQSQVHDQASNEEKIGDVEEYSRQSSEDQEKEKKERLSSISEDRQPDGKEKIKKPLKKIKLIRTVSNLTDDGHDEKSRPSTNQKTSDMAKVGLAGQTELVVLQNRHRCHKNCLSRSPVSNRRRSPLWRRLPRKGESPKLS
ncbi:hypothetical protein NQ317_008888 [Molorchus minor]|uniref:Uncharacterized protein n=1 Tax=Molorchus minor TaxID=1323400 RepID=A0ABQ9JMT3_9CUCU|nr:hypothetical protein NQ317_008888 [Molorchus minor]